MSPKAQAPLYRPMGSLPMSSASALQTPGSLGLGGSEKLALGAWNQAPSTPQPRVLSSSVRIMLPADRLSLCQWFHKLLQVKSQKEKKAQGQQREEVAWASLPITSHPAPSHIPPPLGPHRGSQQSSWFLRPERTWVRTSGCWGRRKLAPLNMSSWELGEEPKG